ncbi:unnamed protein product [Choristocarpus tenellus]
MTSNGRTKLEQQRAWEAFTQHQAKRWFGVWSTYDADGTVLDDVYLDTDLRLSDDGFSVDHVNTMYVGSVKSDCATCHDSDDIREIRVGTYTPENLRQRACGLAYLSGPAVNRRGSLTTEIGLRSFDNRIRCIVVHSVPEDQLLAQEPPSWLQLDKVVIVRENLSAHPVRGEEAAQAVWAEPEPTRWLGLWRGRRDKLLPVSSQSVIELSGEDVGPTHLRKCRCSGSSDAGREATVHLEFKGEIRLETPRIVHAGEPTSLALSWLPLLSEGNVEAGQQHVLRGDVKFEALSRVENTVHTREGVPQVIISPPEMLEFNVEELKPVLSAGLS